MCGELWQGDALHGPALVNPATGRPQRVIIFGLLDDRSRIFPYLEAGFGETEHRFLTVLYNAIARRGIARALLLDNHASFTGYDLRVLCATLNIRLVHCRPGDGPGEGKIERAWRTIREHVLDRLDTQQITTVDELNLRLWSYVEGEYHNRSHSSLSGKTPLEVWESGAEDIRWPSDPGWLEEAFHCQAERTTRNDSTVLWRGVFYEVPPYLRGRKVHLRYSLLDTARVSVVGVTPAPTPVRAPPLLSRAAASSLMHFSLQAGAAETPAVPGHRHFCPVRLPPRSCTFPYRQWPRRRRSQDGGHSNLSLEQQDRSPKGVRWTQYTLALPWWLRSTSFES